MRTILHTVNARPWARLARVFGLGLALVFPGCGSEQKQEDEPELQWFCFGSEESCLCRESPVDEDGEPQFTLLGAEPVEGCWDFDCCIYTEGDEDTLPECECRMTDSESACQERKAATRGAKIVSECAPGAERDLSAYAEAGERCDGHYLYDHELWDCTPGTECIANEDGLLACREITDEILECREAVEAGASGVRLSQPVSVSTNAGEFELTTVDGELAVSDEGCVNSLDLTFAAVEGPYTCTLILEASFQDDELVVNEVQVNLLDCAAEDASLGSLLTTESDPSKIPFTISVVGETCDSGTMSCLIGGVEIHLTGTVGELEFSDATLRVEGAFCQNKTQPGVCP